MMDINEALSRADEITKACIRHPAQQTDLASAIERLATDYRSVSAKLEVSQAATNAAIGKAQWQAVTNAELNRHLLDNSVLSAQVDKLRRALTAAFGNEHWKPDHAPMAIIKQMQEALKR